MYIYVLILALTKVEATYLCNIVNNLFLCRDVVINKRCPFHNTVTTNTSNSSQRPKIVDSLSLYVLYHNLDRIVLHIDLNVTVAPRL